MKVHYLNILLFALPLNILVHNQRNHYSSTPHIQTYRSLCECELYSPSNYDNDLEMKYVMDNFNKQTQQRFREYDERMQKKRQKCKDQCDKEIQKIILKDKMEKELTEKLSILETNIDTNDIPTCICEKSLADKIEKNCMKCGGILGTAVPELGAIGGTLVYAAAVKSATDLGIKIGMETAISDLIGFSGLGRLIGNTKIENFVTSTNYFNKMAIVNFVQEAKITMCSDGANSDKLFCHYVNSSVNPPDLFRRAASIAETAQATGAEAAEAELTSATTPTAFLSNPIILSAIVIACIVAILLAIYLILRYRRNNKMKKKLKYIKLLH
ncbi:rifin PIR protein,putative [Plasmodium sp. DRC-Itaito]|nr:rifin PIR protein,putative [Plasmodium sp. DRC-Itaito]